jgi:hypothetical protein
VNDSEGNRRQNNTFVIDSSRRPIYLYFNSAWNSTGITTVDSWDDGQIQHVRCTTPSDANACATKALPNDVPRVGLYSNRNTTITVGDDGFVRDMFTYFPFGTLELRADPDNSNNAFGMPNFRGAAWLNTLSMGANNSANSTQIAVPPASNNFFGLGNSANSPFSFLIFEWVARSTAATSAKISRTCARDVAGTTDRSQPRYTSGSAPMYIARNTISTKPAAAASVFETNENK